MLLLLVEALALAVLVVVAAAAEILAVELDMRTVVVDVVEADDFFVGFSKFRIQWRAANETSRFWQKSNRK